MAVYPTNIASFTTKADGDVIDNTHINALQAEIAAIELALGTTLTSRSAGTFSPSATTFTSLSERLNNLSDGVVSASTAIHPQYLPKVGGTVNPTASDVTSLVVQASSGASAEVFKVTSADTTTLMSVSYDGSAAFTGAAAFASWIQVTPDDGLQRAVHVTSPTGYSGAVLEATTEGVPKATLTATGNLWLAGDLTVLGSATVTDFTAMNHTHEGTDQGGRVIPAGVIVPWAGGGATPSGWLQCQGQVISRATYADLFDVIGTTYGEGDGATTFSLPSLKGRVPVGIDADQTDFSSLGKTGGSKTSVATHSHSTSHTHTGTSGMMSANTEHSHAYSVNGTGSTGAATSSSAHAGASAGTTAFTTANANTDHAHTFTTGDPSDSTSGSTGSSSGNLPPFLVLSFLIKA